MTTTVYCDEAGFTGDDLLNREQPYFAYSAVAVEPSEATMLVAGLRSSFGFGSRELKGSVLYGRARAEDLVGFLVDVLGARASVALNDKLYALAGKFFEYVYEPGLAADSRFFYERGTHIYVATVLWAFLKHGDAGALEIADRFGRLLRQRPGSSRLFFEGGRSGSDDHPMASIVRFAVAQRNGLARELDTLQDDDGRIKWVLDLSQSSARSVLATLGERLGELDVVMDRSKPLESFVDFLSVFVGREETAYVELNGRRRPLTFNLARPPRFGSSHEEAGLQLADVFASFTVAAMRDRHTPKGKAVLARLSPVMDADCVLPDLGILDLGRKSTVLNACLVAELADRAEAGRPLLLDIRSYAEAMELFYDHNPPDF